MKSILFLKGLILFWKYLKISFIKVSFTLPNATDFDSIEYIEIKENEAFNLVELYNSQASTDRVELLLAKRAKKNEEKSKL